MMTRTFIQVFPEVEFFVDPPISVIMVGSRCPIAGRRRPEPVELKELKIAEELRSISLPDPLALPTLWTASGADLRAYLGPGPLNSWNRMRLEFISYRAAKSFRNSFTATVGNLRLLAAARAHGSGETPEFADPSLLGPMFGLQEAWAKLMSGRLAAGQRLIKEILAEHPNHVSAQRAARAAFDASADEI